MPTRVQDLIKELNKDGWEVDEVSGSIRRFSHPKKSGKIYLSRIDHEWLPYNIYKNILNQAGLK